MRSTPLRAALVALTVIAGSLAARADGDLSTVPRVSLTDFKKQHDQDKVLVIDTRSAESYRGGHIPGAINVPLSAWDQHLPRLKATRKPIVAYCAWPSEHTSARAAQMLDEAGVKGARALLGGWNGWVANGYPMVKGDLPK